MTVRASGDRQEDATAGDAEDAEETPTMPEARDALRELDIARRVIGDNQL